MSKKSCSFLYSKAQNENGQGFLNILYFHIVETIQYTYSFHTLSELINLINRKIDFIPIMETSRF